MKQRMLSAGAALLLLLAVLCPQPAHGLEETDASLQWNHDCSITITPRCVDGEHEVVAHTAFALYRVADLAEEGQNLAYVMTEEFAPSGQSLADVRSPELPHALAQYAAQQGLQGEACQADENGEVHFDPLPHGLYLLVQTETPDAYCVVEPFLVCLPMTEADGSGWVYDVHASPKAQTNPNPPHKTDKPTNKPVDKPDRLIQTGQLNWPVPVLAGSGIVLFAVGWSLVFLGRREDA